MTGLRASATIATLLVAAIWSVTPAAAAGGPLLSGYGGPGEGEQAILGSALLGGSGGAGRGGAGSAGAQSSGEQALAAPTATSAAGGSRHASGASSHRMGGSTAPGRVTTSKDGQEAGTRSGPAASLTDAGGSQPLGLSSEDLLYILIALAALALTAAMTQQLARRSH
jgi:hypothetical protein